MSWEALFDELKFYILGFLPTPTLCKISLTCKSLKQLCDSDIIWKERCSQPKPNTFPTWKQFYIHLSSALRWSNKTSKIIQLCDENKTVKMSLATKKPKLATIVATRAIPILSEFYWEIRCITKPFWLCVGAIVLETNLVSDAEKYVCDSIPHWDWIGYKRKGEYSISSDGQVFDNGVYNFAMRSEKEFHANEKDGVFSFLLLNHKLFCFVNGKNAVWFQLKQEKGYLFPAVTLFGKSGITSATPYRYRNEIYEKYEKQMRDTQLKPAQDLRTLNRLKDERTVEPTSPMEL